MPTIKKKRGRKPGPKKQTPKPAFVEPALTIETDPPPIGRAPKPETVEFQKKLEGVLKLVKPNQAFIIPKEFKGVTKRYVTEKFPTENFVIARIIGNPSSLRVYRYKYEKR